MPCRCQIFYSGQFFEYVYLPLTCLKNIDVPKWYTLPAYDLSPVLGSVRLVAQFES
jgi:hypothetical protein